MVKNILIILMVCCLFTVSGNIVKAQTTVGAHVKLTLYDYKDGYSKIDTASNLKGHEYAGMALTEMIIYVSSDVSDNISIDMQPMFNTSTGATPKFGKEMGNNKFSNVQPTFNEWRRAALTVVLPYELEMSVGIVKPRFTWDYGTELFWEEELNGGKFSCNDFLGAMHESGIELYKPLELGFISLPTYLYVLNGGTNNLFNDNNGSPTLMIHAEPEIGGLRLHGSLANGKYDDAGKYNMTRYAAGVAYQLGNVSARAEVAGGVWEKSIAAKTLEDATPLGYYGKVFYRFSSWGKMMLHYDYAKHNFNGFFTNTDPGEEIYTTLTPGLQISVSPSSMIQVQYDIAHWQKWKSDDVTQTLKFGRMTVGWRTTF